MLHTNWGTEETREREGVSQVQSKPTERAERGSPYTRKRGDARVRCGDYSQQDLAQLAFWRDR